MIDHELTDPAGGALTITHDHQGVWITATEDRDEVTVGPFPARTLRASFDMGGDLLDGGVTAAAIEAEVVSPERARSLVQENDELRARIGRVEEARDLYRHDAATEERLHGEARRFALAWKETARREFQYRVLARTAREFYRGIARKFEESRDAAMQERGDAIARAESARELFHGANLKIVAMRKRAEKAEQERDNKAAAYDQMKLLFGDAERAAIRWRARAEKAEQERDAVAEESKARADCIREQQKMLDRRPAENPRPLTADDYERGVPVLRDVCPEGFKLSIPAHEAVRAIVDAALTPPPSRPEGAEGLADDLSGWDEMDDYGNRRFTHEELDDLADHLAARGWTKGEE